MNASWLRPNLYVVQNGKLVPRSTTPEQKKNYRYIPYDSLNNPGPEDYFRQTISRLQKENAVLKDQLASKLSDQTSRSNLANPALQSEQVNKMKAHISMLIKQLTSRDHTIEEKNQLINSKDKRILELGNQNTRLHLRINSVVKEIQSLNLIMSRKDEEIMSKKEQIEEYCHALERLTQKEKEQEKTMFSENNLATPRIEQANEEEDQFYSIQCNSLNDHRSLLSQRYRTPEIQGFKVDDSKKYMYRSQGQINPEDSFNSSKISRESSQNDLKSSQISNNSDLNQNLKNWPQWAQSNIKNSFSYDLLKQQIDPTYGGLSLLSSRK